MKFKKFKAEEIVMNVVHTKIVQEFSCLRYAGSKRSFNEVCKFIKQLGRSYREAQFHENNKGMVILFGTEGYVDDTSIGLNKGDWICSQKFGGRNFDSDSFFTLTNQEFRNKFLPL